MLYTVAYPELDASDGEFIRAFRDEHDLPYRDVVAPHFTLVFGCDEITEAAYLKHVEMVATKVSPIAFRCRYAQLGDDASDDTAYVFLVPDEGYSGLSLLHDALYSGPLVGHLRLDVPFIPHITIGTLKDPREAKGLCDELNRRGIDIGGTVDRVTVGALEDGKLRDVDSFPLGSFVETSKRH